MHLHAGGEEAQSSERVGLELLEEVVACAKKLHSAKYIEGLENRLGRMEALLKLSGLLGDDNSDRTDLGTLEKRLADRSLQQGNGLTQPTVSEDSSTHAIQPQKLDVAENTSQEQNYSSVKKPEEQEGVEEISDMMCSLVTNSCGETRYIGM